jgi:hypothetical protein
LGGELQSHNPDFLADCDRIHHEWHERAKSRDMEGLLTLYAQDAVLETPLVQAIYYGRRDGILRGHSEIGPFFAEATRRPLNELVRWYRSGRWLTDGQRLLAWEYPRATLCCASTQPGRTARPNPTSGGSVRRSTRKTPCAANRGSRAKASRPARSHDPSKWNSRRAAASPGRDLPLDLSVSGARQWASL